jgi:hypothetical protein
MKRWIGKITIKHRKETTQMQFVVFGELRAGEVGVGDDRWRWTRGRGCLQSSQALAARLLRVGLPHYIHLQTTPMEVGGTSCITHYARYLHKICNQSIKSQDMDIQYCIHKFPIRAASTNVPNLSNFV